MLGSALAVKRLSSRLYRLLHHSASYSLLAKDESVVVEMAEYRDYGPAAPHGPDMSGTHNPLHDMTQNERQIFDYLLKPDDSYNRAGVYWGDMSWAQQIKFVMSGDAKESKRELSNIWAMFKRDPLSPVSYYMKNMVLPGAGLGLEGYVQPLPVCHFPRLTFQICPFFYRQHQASIPSQGCFPRVLETALQGL